MTDKPITITADNGSKFELVTNPMFEKDPQGPGYLLKPVAAQEEKVEKHQYHLKLDGPSPTADYLFSELMFLTEPTAQALADAIKALVEYVQLSEGAKEDVEAGSYANLFESVGNAKVAFQKAKAKFAPKGAA